MAKKVRGESHPKPKRASWPASRDEETPEDRAHLDAKLAHQFAEFARLDAKAAPLIVEGTRRGGYDPLRHILGPRGRSSGGRSSARVVCSSPTLARGEASTRTHRAANADGP
jgi:hypothetical protein